MSATRLRKNRWGIAAMVVLLLTVMGGAARPAPAHADWIWCWSDPTLVIGGTAVHINLGVPREHRGTISGSSLTVVVPANVPVHLNGAGIPQFPINVNLVRAGIYLGVGPIPVTATGLITAPLGTPTSLYIWQASKGPLDQVVNVAGVAMVSTVLVQK